MQSISRIGERTLSTNALAAIVLSHRSYYGVPSAQRCTYALFQLMKKSAARANLTVLM